MSKTNLKIATDGRDTSRANLSVSFAVAKRKLTTSASRKMAVFILASIAYVLRHSFSRSALSRSGDQLYSGRQTRTLLFFTLLRIFSVSAAFGNFGLDGVNFGRDRMKDLSVLKCQVSQIITDDGWVTDSDCVETMFVKTIKQIVDCDVREGRDEDGMWNLPVRLKVSL